VHKVAIWHGGFIEAARRLDAWGPWLDGAIDDNALTAVKSSCRPFLFDYALACFAAVTLTGKSAHRIAHSLFAKALLADFGGTLAKG
jgi:hypothetical protein